MPVRAQLSLSRFVAARASESAERARARVPRVSRLLVLAAILACYDLAHPAPTSLLR